MNAAFVGGVVFALFVYFLYTKVKAAQDKKKGGGSGGGGGTKPGTNTKLK